MFVCPNPQCSRTFRLSRAAAVHIGKSRLCKRWRKDFVRSKSGISVDRIQDGSGDPSLLHRDGVEMDLDNPFPSPFHASDDGNELVGSIMDAVNNSPPWLDYDSVMDSDPPSRDHSHEPDDIAFVEAASQASHEEERHDASEIRTEKHESAGFDFGKGRTIIDEIDGDQFAHERLRNRFYPFSSRDDFEVGAWFIRSSVSMADIDTFLGLSAVSNYLCAKKKENPICSPFSGVQMKNKFSFRSAKDLHDKIAVLPQPPPWMSTIVSVDGGSTQKPITFYHRNAFQMFRFQYGNPLFAHHQSNVPVQIWNDGVQIFEGPMTGKLCWEIQNKIGAGETLGLVILGSDKTALNKCYGDKKAHCVYMSCGNISKDLRMKGSAGCWVKIAEIPEVKFLEKTHQGLLSQRLFHICMDIVTAGLKACSHHPEMMTDANGIKRLVRTVLLAHVSDLPEQQLIACVQQNYSPVSMANLDQFGSSEKHPPRTKRVTLHLIRTVLQTLGMEAKDLALYKTASLALGLNGVHDPYWSDWKFACPSVFLAPDALHQWHKFFYDHIISWTETLLSRPELDGRYARLQKRIGFSHFSAGFTYFSQHTCREFRELQRSFIAVIAGHRKLNDSAMLAFRGLMEFIYYAQFDSQSSSSLAKLEASLSLFHENKESLSAARGGPIQGGQFRIPKLNIMHYVRHRAELIGSLPQYSTEQIERCHITMAKEPYRASNRKNHEEQVCRYLDRHEKIALFSL
ncbi:hypothetical protein SCHPADRAFT_897360, partial [Schizopora paradoxa]